MNEIVFLENHLRTMYKFLGHEGYVSRIGSMDYATKKYENLYAKSEQEVIDYARQWNGKRNIFIGRGARDTDGNVFSGSIRCITFDIDPIRDKGLAATDEQHSNAINAGRRILEAYPGGYLCSSGNGCLLLYHVPDGISDYVSHYAKEALLIKELQRLVDNLNVRIDATGYAEAMLKGIGTFSTKGESSLRRCSRWIMYPLQEYTNCGELLERLNQIELPKQSPSATLDVKQLASKFSGDRSIADYNLVSFLKQSGVKPEDALVALKANPLGRQTDEKDQARLITKIYGDIQIGPGTTEKETYFTDLFKPNSTDEHATTTGIKNLDAILGPLPKAEITTISARSGFGKSSIACTMSEQWRKAGKRVLYFSTEMDARYIMHKFVSIACDIPLQTILEKKFSLDQITAIKEYRQHFEKHPVYICDEFQPTIQLVQNEVIKHKPEIIVFDHATQSGTHWEYVAQFARGLKELTAKEGLITVLLSQLNEPPRGSKGDVGPSVRGDVRGSQEILFLSAIFIMMNNIYEVKTNNQPVEIEICKNRYGVSGLKAEACVNKDTGKYSDLQHNDKQ